MSRLSRLVILVILAVLGTNALLLAGCEGEKVTVTIPPITLTAPPVTHTVTTTPTTTVVVTTTPVILPGLAPASVTISPIDTNYKIFTLHTITALVTSANGTPVSGVSVEWMINRVPDSVGDIVYLEGADPQKINNTWGTVKTDNNGLARLNITSVYEGDTYIMVYVPGISKYDDRRVYIIKHWVQ